MQSVRYSRERDDTATAFSMINPDGEGEWSLGFLIQNPISLLAHLSGALWTLDSSHMLPLVGIKKLGMEICSVTDLCRRGFHPSSCSSGTPRALCRSRFCILDMLGIRRSALLCSRCGTDRHLAARTFHAHILRDRAVCRSSHRSIRPCRPSRPSGRKCSGRRSRRAACTAPCTSNYSSAHRISHESYN